MKKLFLDSPDGLNTIVRVCERVRRGDGMMYPKWTDLKVLHCWM